MKECKRSNNNQRDKGDGTVYQRKDGRWVARFRPPTANKPIYAYAKTEREARKKLQDLRRSVKVVTKKDFLAPCIESWMHTFKYPVLERRSFDRMEDIFLKHLEPLFRQQQIGSITSVDLQKILNDTQDKMSYSSAKQIRNVLRDYFKYAVTCGDVLINPMDYVELPKKSHYKPPTEMLILEDEEVKMLENVANLKCHNGVPKMIHANIIVFMLNTGIRRGEMLGLKWEDVNLKKKVVNINKSLVMVKNRDDADNKNKLHWILKAPKTHNGIRKVPLNQKAVNAIKALSEIYQNRNIKDQFIARTRHGNPIGGTGMRSLLDNMIELAGINKELTVHQLRHTFASRALKAGINIEMVSKWLGHSSTNVTYNTYIHMFEEEKREAVVLLEAL